MAGAVRTAAYQEMLTYLIAARNEAQLSQAELAKLLGKPPSFVGKYELGERRLDVVELVVIARALDRNAADVIALIEEKMTPTV